MSYRSIDRVMTFGMFLARNYVYFIREIWNFS